MITSSLLRDVDVTLSTLVAMDLEEIRHSIQRTKGYSPELSEVREAIWIMIGRGEAGLTRDRKVIKFDN